MRESDLSTKIIFIASTSVWNKWDDVGATDGRALMTFVRLFAFVAFVASYLIALRSLAGHGNGASEWVFLVGILTALPALAFWGMMYALFLKFRWSVTILLTIVAVGVSVYFGKSIVLGWTPVFQAMLVATIVHQLTLLLGARAIATQWPAPPV